MKMALDILDGGYLRPKYQIAVKKADFGATKISDGAEGDGAGVGTGKSEDNNGKRVRNEKLSHAQYKVARSAMKQGTELPLHKH